MNRCYECEQYIGPLSPRSRCVNCEHRRSMVNEKLNDNLQDILNRRDATVNRLTNDKVELMNQLSYWRLAARGWNPMQTETGYKAISDEYILPLDINVFESTTSWYHLEQLVTRWEQEQREQQPGYLGVDDV